MECFICRAAAAEIPTQGDYFERACPACGHYKISRTAITLLEDNGWTLDAEHARRWLAAQQGSGVIPMISSSLAAGMISS